MLHGHIDHYFARGPHSGPNSGIVIVHRDGRILSATPWAELSLGLKPGHGDYALPGPLLELALNTITSGTRTLDWRYQLPSATHTHKTLLVSALPLTSPETISGAVLLLAEPPLDEQLGSNLQQLGRLANLGTLAAAMAHEIKNAMVAGKTFVDLLIEKNQESDIAQVARHELLRIDAIVARMLSFAKPPKTTFAPVQLHKVLDHSIEMVKPQITDQLITLQRQFDAATDTVNGNIYELQQALVNLLLNALDAMGEHGTLTVLTETLPAMPGDSPAAPTGGSPAALRISIQDTGVGIAPEQMEKLFTAFHTTKPNGTGLGLAITRRIIHEHRGEIAVESRPGCGTTFSIILPLAEAVD